MTVYVLELDQCPPVELAPNKVLRRGGHYKAIPAEAYYRAYAGYAALNEDRVAFADPVDVSIHVTWPRSKRGPLPDCDAHAGMCKPILDALQDVGVLHDDAQIARISYSRTRGDAAGVRVEVKLAA